MVQKFPIVFDYRDNPRRHDKSSIPQYIEQLPCTHRGEQLGELDCVCQGKIPYYTCLHPSGSIEYASPRKARKAKGNPKTVSCLSCPHYQTENGDA